MMVRSLDPMPTSVCTVVFIIPFGYEVKWRWTLFYFSNRRLTLVRRGVSEFNAERDSGNHGGLIHARALLDLR